MERLPGGHVIADTVFIPKQVFGYPAMVVELKWNKSSEGAIVIVLTERYKVG